MTSTIKTSTKTSLTMKILLALFSVLITGLVCFIGMLILKATAETVVATPTVLAFSALPTFGLPVWVIIAGAFGLIAIVVGLFNFKKIKAWFTKGEKETTFHSDTVVAV